jgi:hypothetical protein
MILFTKDNLRAGKSSIGADTVLLCGLRQLYKLFLYLIDINDIALQHLP